MKKDNTSKSLEDHHSRKSLADFIFECEGGDGAFDLYAAAGKDCSKDTANTNFIKLHIPMSFQHVETGVGL